MTQHAGIARTDADCRRIGIHPDVVAEWEDGARTDGRRGTYEWWYFDAHLDDGATLVVIFMTKDLSTPGKPLSPMIRLNLDVPGGHRYNVIQNFPATSFSAGADRADVRIAGNVFSGDLAHYEIRADVGGVRVDVTLDAEIRPWRPHTGYVVFGEERDLEFSWLPAVDVPTTVRHVRELLEDTIQRQLISAVPLCTLLSGGLDSSAMTALAARFSAERIRSFAVDFVGHIENFTPNAVHGTPDGPYRHEVAKFVSTDHRDITLGRLRRHARRLTRAAGKGSRPPGDASSPRTTGADPLQVLVDCAGPIKAYGPDLIHSVRTYCPIIGGVL